MSRYYFDASALVKTLVREKGSERAEALLKEAVNAYTASVAYVEVIATLRRRHQDQQIPANSVDGLLAQWDACWAALDYVGLDDSIFQIVRYDPESSGQSLRALDTIHLASALLLRKHGLDFAFVCSDTKLKTAAISRGFSVIDPEQVT